jgi:mRNA interferase YafQ
MEKRGKDIHKLESVMSLILHDQPLEAHHKDHKLQGEFLGRRECHIESDWLPIYKPKGDTIVFERTGTHADLFNQ